MNSILLRLPLLLLVLVAGLVWAAPALAVVPSSAQFDVEIDDSPPVDIKPDDDDCVLSGFPPTSSTCTVDYANAETLSSTMEGSITDAATGATGDIDMVCAWNLRMHAVSTVTIATMAMTFSELSGGGDQNCSWTIAFADGASLSGTLVGDMALALVPATPPTEISMTGSFSVAVINGTGRWANAVGSGTFTEDETMLLPTSPSGGMPTMDRIISTRAGEGSGMRLRLSTGAPRASIYSPGNADRITRTSKQTLRVFAGRGSTCTAVATKGTATVSLGTAKDATPRDGRVVFAKRLSSLPVGTWKLRATCSMPRPGGRPPVRAIAVRTFVRA
jgi:hypothetical protein